MSTAMPRVYSTRDIVHRCAARRRPWGWESPGTWRWAGGAANSV